MTTPAPGFPWPGPTPGDPAPNQPGQAPAAGELLDAWASVMAGYTHVTRVLTEKIEQETSLPAPSFFVLLWLLRSGQAAVSLSTLARQVAFSSGGFTKVADRLEDAGLIQRQPPPPAAGARPERAAAVYCDGLHELVLQHLGSDGLLEMAGQMSLLAGQPQ